ncbi:MAG: DUF167 domain-containing protein [Nevskia sp.]|nr:DUF167 domain-containing protein [Nevskia sp.]
MARLEVKVSPKASRDAVSGWLGGALKVSVRAAPERGKANEAVEALLAEVLELPRSAVTVVAGHTARNKRLEIAGLDDGALRERLCTIVEHAARRRR